MRFVEHVTKFLKRVEPKYNFLTVHYIYIISCCMIGSLLIYAGGGISYIDALFFACGACTQAGLNVIDVNLLNTWQQFMIFFLACICNVVIINTGVVVVRLYWFTRRFKHIVEASRQFIRTRSMSVNIHDSGDEERAVGGRRIRVLLSTGKTMNSARSIPNRDVPLEVLKAGEDQLEGMDSERNGESSKDSDRHGESSHSVSSKRKSSSSSHESRDLDMGPHQRQVKKEVDEMLSTPVAAERTGRDIRFGDLPQPRKNLDRFERTNTDILQSESAIDDTEDDSGRRTIAIDDDATPRRRDSFQPRLRRATYTGFARVATFERILSNTFRRRRRDGSPSSRRSSMTLPYFTFQPTVGRNSLFVGLTEEQREELGGVEYRAVKLLLKVLLVYFFGLTAVGWLCLGPWIVRDGTFGAVVDNAGVSRGWWAIFTGASLFNDLGYTLTNDSMISFQRAVFPLLLGSFLIVAGNTGFPCFLRLIIWILFKIFPHGSPAKETLAFLLDHPRRCFTLLFPSSATWWLFGVLVILNVLDLFFFLVLDLGDNYVSAIPIGYRFLDGFFQAVSTRTAGFAVTNLQLLHPAVLVSYMVMMYISVFPVAISIRRTNVYEEKSLGIYAHEDEGNTSFVATHMRRQLGFDLWYIFLGLFIICIVEASQIQDTNNYWFNIFNVLFEVVSGYGCVGLSIGYPTVNASFSSQFHTLSKLVMCALMIRGRHRGLPYALDKAIMLPKRTKPEEVQHQRRRMSMASSTGIDRGRHEE